MRFEEISTPVPGMRTWGTYASGYTFLISLDTESTGPEWAGYNASWKNTKADMTPFGKQPANRIDGGPWPTFKQAEQACQHTLRQLKSKA